MAGATDRESITEQLSQGFLFRSARSADHRPGHQHVVQNIYVYETVADGDGLTQKMIGTIGLVRDPANGCT